ncbi:MAG: DivIVA domain-containing protein [Acidimicrobiia bacterium]
MADTRASRSTSPMPATANAVSTAPATAWLTPERVARAEFRSGFRGLDSAEVRAFLARVASELRTMLEREAELVARLEQAEERSTAVVPAPLDIHQVSELLGQETARVLETAREAAADIKARAASDADATLEAATAEADRLRHQAEGLLAERTTEADEAAATIRADAEAAAARLIAEAEERAAAVTASAEADAARLRADADAALTQARTDADATREAARDEGKRMVAEARAVRERVLTDMARRRNVARQQLERVRAARERLLEAIDAVRQGVADTHSQLSGSLVDAKLAGDRAARTVDVDDIPSLRELDAEVELAKDTGLIDLTALEPSAEDFSPVETGEFAAVTAPEPAVDRSGEAGGEPTASMAAIVIDDAEQSTGAVAAAADAPAAPDEAGTDPADAVEPAAATPAAATPAASGPAASGTVSPVTPATAKQPARPLSRPISGRAGGVEVVRRTTAPATAASSPAAPAEVAPTGEAVAATDDAVIDLRDAAVEAPAGDTPEATATEPDTATEPGNPTEPKNPTEATGAAEATEELRDETSPGPADRPDGPGPSGGSTGGRRSSGRRALKDADKANELFARLRNRDERPANGSATADATSPNERGSAKVIGLAVAERSEPTPGGEAAGSSAGTGDAADADEAATDQGAVDADRVVLHKRDAVLAPTIRDLSRQLKLALSDQQNELLEASRNAKGQPDPVVAPLTDMVAVYAQAAREALTTAWTLGRRSVLGANDAADATGGAADEVAAEVRALADGIVDALLPRLQGGDPSEPWPVDRVRAAYREVRSQRLGELVEHHVHRAYAGGQLAAAAPGTRGRWVCDTCGPDCLDNALAGPLPFGEAYPTGHAAPPAFAGCRCALTVVDGDR